MPIATTQVKICNSALARMGRGSIISMEERSEPAKQCREQWNIAVRACLRDFPWNFATRIKKLATASVTDEQTPPGWIYVYEHPSSALYIRQIYNATTVNSTTPVNHKIIDLDQVGIVILANIPEAYAEYTAEVLDVTKFDASFADALAWRLAADMAVPLTGNKELREHLLAIYDKTLVKAMESNVNEGNEPRERQSSYLDSRR